MLHELCNFGFVNQDRCDTNPLFVEDMGIEYRQEEQYYFDNQQRKDFEGFLFQYTFAGEGHIEIEGRNITLRSGDAFLLEMPHQSCYYLEQKPDIFWHYGYIHFTGRIGNIFLTEIAKRKGNVFTINTNSQPIRMFLEECSALQKGKRYGQLKNSEWMYGFLCTLIREMDAPEAAYTPLVERAVHWMESSYQEKVGIGDLCHALGVSQAHMSRAFHQSLGYTPVAYLTKLRLDHGIELLLNTTLSVERIAELCGFDSANYFAKVFKRFLKVSPTVYRNCRRTNGYQEK